MKLHHCSYVKNRSTRTSSSNAYKLNPRQCIRFTDIKVVSALRLFVFLCALGICICCSPVMICCLWRTGFSTRKLIHYRCCIWGTSPCLVAWHSLSKCGHSPPLFLKDCRYLRSGVTVLRVSSAQPLCHLDSGFLLPSRVDQDTLSDSVYSSVCLLYFFPLSLITCQSGTDSLCDSFIGCMALTLVESVRTPQLSKRISSSYS